MVPADAFSNQICRKPADDVFALVDLRAPSAKETNDNRQMIVCKIEEVPEGMSLKIEVNDRPPIAIFNIKGIFHAIDDTCSHADASLSEGDIEGDCVICPVHWAKFHIPTGEPRTFPATCPVKVHLVNIIEGEVHVVRSD